MTATLDFSDLFSVAPVPYEPVTVQSLRRTGQTLPSLSATDWRPLARGALRSIEHDCGVDHWDGPGSRGVVGSTLSAARLIMEQLYRQLPKTVPGPDLVAEVDGEIDFSWYNREGLSVSMSVSPRGTATYAANFGKKGVDHGWKSVDEAVETVVPLVIKLYRAEVGRGRS